MSPAAPKVEGIAYLVCATQRSGSTLLCELLKGTDVAGVPEEFFETLRSTGLPRSPGEYFRDERLDDLIAGLPAFQFGSPEKAGEFEGWFTYALQRGTSTNGVFGAKMMWNYFDDFRERIAELPGLGALTFTEALDVVFPRTEDRVRPPARQGGAGRVVVEGDPDTALAQRARTDARRRRGRVRLPSAEVPRR